ncbi:MAG: serine/threonine-protein phosphatase [Candidatus Brocadiae bacterium]|nr:serine/threonine-protein phosphatase [Candidatus Brocadiia bacterium]
MFDRKRQSEKEREEERQKNWLESVLRAERAWSVTALGKQWICPLCVVVAVEYDSIDELPDLIWEHLSTRCTPFQAGIRQPKRNEDELKEMAREIDIRAQVVTSPVWQQRDSRGRWYCPYCARETDIVIPRGGSITTEHLKAITKHVGRCFAFEHGRGAMKSVEVLKQEIESFESKQRMYAAVKQRVEQNPVWRARTPMGKWICPFCREALGGVDVSTQLLLTSTAPHQIAQHLATACRPYREKKEPAATAEELEAPHRPKSATPKPSEAEGQYASEVTRRMQAEVDALKAEMTATEGMKRGLEQAGKRQQRMLPETPKLPGFDFHVLFKPCDVVTGDFYDFPRISEDEIGVLIGDVSGHGIEAGIVMSLIRKVISIHARGNASPKQTLTTANVDIYPDLDRAVFATVCYAVLNTRTRQMKIVRAGHNPVLIYNAASGEQPLSLEPGGMAIGMDRGPRFEATLEEITVDLRPGDLVMLYTDGVNEQTSAKGEEFGHARVLDTLVQNGAYDAKYLMMMTDAALMEFKGPTRPLDDDVTVIGIKVK